jgi:predicted RNA-binding Zn-ribbon protein involved in translation (DUF1610 family)
MTNHQNYDIIFSLEHLQEKAKHLEGEAQSLQSDLGRITNSLNQAVSVYEIDGQEIVITYADVERIRSQLNRSYPEDKVRQLAAVNKLEAMRTLAISNGVIITKSTNMDRWLLTWGIGLFLYSLVWLVILIAGYFIDPVVLLGLENDMVKFIWFLALPGGIGGVVSILYSLAYLWQRGTVPLPLNAVYYLVQPAIGMVLGGLLSVVITIMFSTETDGRFELPSYILALSVVLSWFVGFRQRVFLEIIENIGQSAFSKEKENSSETVIEPIPVENQQKCPNCGAMISQDVIRCNWCGKGF